MADSTIYLLIDEQLYFLNQDNQKIELKKLYGKIAKHMSGCSHYLVLAEDYNLKILDLNTNQHITLVNPVNMPAILSPILEIRSITDPSYVLDHLPPINEPTAKISQTQMV